MIDLPISFKAILPQVADRRPKFIFGALPEGNRTRGSFSKLYGCALHYRAHIDHRCRVIITCCSRKRGLVRRGRSRSILR
jgi:hypothetical protein